MYEEGKILSDWVEAEFKRRGMEGVEKVFPCGSFSDRVKILCRNSDSMWKFLVAMKGTKLTCEAHAMKSDHKLWHGIDKYEFEIQLGYRQRAAAALLREKLIAKGAEEEIAKMAVNDRNDDGSVIFVPKGTIPGAGHRPCKIFEQDPITHHLRVCTNAQETLTGCGVDVDLNAELPTINAATRPRTD